MEFMLSSEALAHSIQAEHLGNVAGDSVGPWRTANSVFRCWNSALLYGKDISGRLPIREVPGSRRSIPSIDPGQLPIGVRCDKQMASGYACKSNFPAQGSGFDCWEGVGRKSKVVSSRHTTLANTRLPARGNHQCSSFYGGDAEMRLKQ